MSLVLSIAKFCYEVKVKEVNGNKDRNRLSIFKERVVSLFEVFKSDLLIKFEETYL